MTSRSQPSGDAKSAATNAEPSAVQRRNFPVSYQGRWFGEMYGKDPDEALERVRRANPAHDPALFDVQRPPNFPKAEA
jgi:hypothetical protein